jgi:hypothetical protein
MRRCERAQARSTDARRAAAALEVGTEAAETGNGRQDIFAFRETMNPAFALRQGSEHQDSVSNRLIARDRQFAGHARRR